MAPHFNRSTSDTPTTWPCRARHGFLGAGAREKLAEIALGGELAKAYARKAASFAAEMHDLRFGLKPSAVYFNPTERCNLDCTYCYIPQSMRRNGQHMAPEKLLAALAALKRYFRAPCPRARCHRSFSTAPSRS